jgi:hypothetical protein
MVLLASLTLAGTGTAAPPYSAAGLACTSTAVTSSSESGHVPARQYRYLSKTATNSTVRAIAKRLAQNPKDASALSDFSKWCKDRYPNFRPIQSSDFDYDH